jgi:hypothetical protein
VLLKHDLIADQTILSMVLLKHNLIADQTILSMVLLKFFRCTEFSDLLLWISMADNPSQKQEGFLAQDHEGFWP